MWLLLAFLSAALLGCYDSFKKQALRANAVLPVRLAGQNVPQGRLVTLLAFFTLYIIMLLVTAVAMVLSGIDITNAMTISLSLISNVGAGLDTNIGPQMSWSDLSDGLKWLCSLVYLGVKRLILKHYFHYNIEDYGLHYYKLIHMKNNQ